MKKALAAALLSALLPMLAGAAVARSTAGAAPLPPLPGEVIVKFKAQAATLRAQALSARAEAATVAAVLGGRAQALGARAGRALTAGAAVGPRAQVVRAAGIDAAALAALLAADPEVEYAVPNGRKRAFTAPTDPYSLAGPAVDLALQTGGPDAGQWYLRKPDATLRSAIDIEAAWARGMGSSSVVVAVLDTGVRYEHPDLGRTAAGGRVLPGRDFVSDLATSNDGDGRDDDASDPGDWVTGAEQGTALFAGCAVSDSSWHGTHTASLVAAAANDGIGMAGTAPGVQVLPVRVLGKCFGSDADIQAGMLWAAGIHVDGVPDNPRPARVLNMSLGYTCSIGVSCACTAAYQDVVDQVTARGALVLAAAGNSAGGPVGEPANCRGVVSVLALRHAGTKVGFSDLGPEVTIAAPGGNCVNTRPREACLYPILAATNRGQTVPDPAGYGYTDSFDYTLGTSFATPLVAGVAALMFSQQPALTPAKLAGLLRATARPFPTEGGDNGDGTTVLPCAAPVLGVPQYQCYCSTGLCGAGMLDAGHAVAAAAGTPVAHLVVGTAAPTAGTAVTFSASGSLAATGALLSGYAWSVVDGGGIVGSFSPADGSTASITPSGAGRFTVQLRVTDNLGNSDTVTQAVTVAAAPSPAAAPASPGGGAASLCWVLGVLLAAVVLHGGRGRAS